MSGGGYNVPDASTGLFRPVQSYFPPDQAAFVTLRSPATRQDGNNARGGEMRRTTFSTEPPVKLVQGFLSDDEAAQLVDYACQDSTLWIPTHLLRSVDASKYSSCSTVMKAEHSQLASTLRARFAAVAGVPLSQVEDLNLVRLCPGQSHRAVHDGRHRSISAHVYLNDVDDGGETRFTKLGVQFEPEKGCLVMWPSLEMTADGSTAMDWRTLREERSAGKVTKYLLQAFVNASLDKQQLVQPGYERIYKGHAPPWWSFPSLGDRYACDLSLPALTQAYPDTSGLLVLSSGTEPFMAVAQNVLDIDLMRAVTQLLSTSPVEKQSYRLQEASQGQAENTKTAAEISALEENIKARVGNLLRVEPTEVEDIVVERYTPGSWMDDTYAGAHRAYSLLIYLGDLTETTDATSSGATTQFRHIPARILPARNTCLVWSNLAQDGRADQRVQRSELPAIQRSRAQLLCHVRAGQHGPCGPAFKAGQWSVIPPVCPAGAAKLLVGPGQDFETAEDIFQPCPLLFRSPYLSVLKFLKEAELLAHLPVTTDSTIHVNVPFCAAFPECTVLTDFLREVVRPQAETVTILGSEYDDKAEVGRWRQKEQFVARKYAGMSLQMKQMDLTNEPLPKCSFSIALHPEATKDGPWPAIIENVVKSTAEGGGICVFCTFSSAEVTSVVSTLDKLKARSQVHENPFWQVQPVPTPQARGNMDASAGGGLEPIAPYMRYIIVVRR
eukprot:TRINITY_DN81266_c0_g1_i1.p1 TRINITY_DN81266_c0_g1~~TRINITY_DN81266_c0_g1_i1.p1  ORF type:complete len:725 (-),score=95.70 TRINITY_DN81266_c0_g1_i1:166-2340(-)